MYALQKVLHALNSPFVILVLELKKKSAHQRWVCFFSRTDLDKFSIISSSIWHFDTIWLTFYVERLTAHHIKIIDNSCFHNRWPTSKTKLNENIFESKGGTLVFLGRHAACVFCVYRGSALGLRMRIFSENVNFGVNHSFNIEKLAIYSQTTLTWLNWIIVPLYEWCFFLFSLSVVNAINNHSVRYDRLDERESSALCDGYHEYKTLIYDKVSLWPDMWWSPVFKADNTGWVEVWHWGTLDIWWTEKGIPFIKWKKKLLQRFLWHLQPSRGVKKDLRNVLHSFLNATRNSDYSFAAFHFQYLCKMIVELHQTLQFPT